MFVRSLTEVSGSETIVDIVGRMNDLRQKWEPLTGPSLCWLPVSRNQANIREATTLPNDSLCGVLAYAGLVSH